MVDLRRVPVEWTTGVGGSGVSIFYTLDPADATASLGTFFNAIKDLFPPVVSWSIPASGDTITDTTGRLSGSWSGGTAATITGTNNTLYAGGTGGFIRWYTNTVLDGRKFVGRTYMVPLVTSTYSTNGVINSTALGTLQTAATALVTATAHVIYHRPPTGTFSGGFFAEATSAVVPNKVTSLKTRRV